MKLFHLVFIFLPIHGKFPDHEKVEFCETLECDESVDEKVCGVKYEENDVIFKPFDNECKLLKYGCQVNDSERHPLMELQPDGKGRCKPTHLPVAQAPDSYLQHFISPQFPPEVTCKINTARCTYGIINMRHCTAKSMAGSENIEHVQLINTCTDCTEGGDPVCGIRPDGEGFKIRMFTNECRLNRYNCEKEHEELQFTVTDFFICSYDPSLDTKPNSPIKTNKNLVIVDGSMLDPRNINESIRHFFAATHILDLPIRDIQPMFNESTRKRMIKIFGPIKVFKPWTTIPKNISDDKYHEPTLSTCYHRCPTECPDIYSPVCGMPGHDVREPSIMFKNHCFMDMAQCKVRWEKKSFTSTAAVYIEASFVFCVGNELWGMYRLLPLMRTLQHMGRLKKKGRYRYKLRNMRFLNNVLSKEPTLMG